MHTAHCNMGGSTFHKYRETGVTVHLHNIAIGQSLNGYAYVYQFSWYETLYMHRDGDGRLCICTYV